MWQLDNYNLDMNIDEFEDIYKQLTIRAMGPALTTLFIIPVVQLRIDIKTLTQNNKKTYQTLSDYVINNRPCYGTHLFLYHKQYAK